MSTITKSLAGDFTSGLDSGQFHKEVDAGGFTPNLLSIDIDPLSNDPDRVDIVFDATLPGGEVAALDALIAAHVPDPSPINTDEIAVGVQTTGDPVVFDLAPPSGANQILITSSATNASWQDLPTDEFIDGGEVGGAARTLGNTDNFDLGFLTNNVNRMNITGGGNVAIGTNTNPGTSRVLITGFGTGSTDAWLRLEGGGGSDAGVIQYYESGVTNAPAILLSDQDDPPRILFQQIGTGSEASPQFLSTIGMNTALSDELLISASNVVFDGTINGIRHYGASATDPVSPTPAAGDEYYNTVINEKMVYDASRSKWLSITTLWDGAGRNGNTGANTFYRRFNGMSLSATTGAEIPQGTITYIGYTTSNTITHTLEVLVNGVVIATLASGGSASASDSTVNADFPAGNISFRNQAGSSTTNNFQCTVYYKLRA